MSLIFVAVVGLIGTGKTTLMGALARVFADSGYRVFVIKEDVDAMRETSVDGRAVKPLALAADDPARWAGPFQLYAYTLRLFQQIDGVAAAQKWADEHPHVPVVVLSERCGRCDKIFYDVGREAGHISDLDAVNYELVRRFRPLPTPDVYVYLQADPETCMERIVKRDRAEELGPGMVDYLRTLHDKHEAVYGSGANVFVVKNDADIPDTKLTPELHPHAGPVFRYVNTARA